ncbi:DUF3019 domain-containing protein [Alkalimonas amylolytica]|uniref:DUF3019 domain-containing protein n=1 Tax=Alkalimonas amylolytica TaxID=152573 RepID=A0A1H3ZJ54_ALKAM|nr:DUF3019 domain-containing protein [Alkalimonas amylolytica]SEA23707.1 Protein of unknown function [Alkalimonas amylolytica]
MYFNGLLLGLSLLLFIPAKVKAEPTFTASPTTCVTLQQGRDCHATVQFRWQLSQDSPVCLYLEQQQLHCWQQQQQVEFEYRFVETSSRSFYLKQGETILASHRLEVSWVQTSQRSRHWRRF